jgi:hypothetical protein
MTTIELWRGDAAEIARVIRTREARAPAPTPVDPVA